MQWILKWFRKTQVYAVYMNTRTHTHTEGERRQMIKQMDKTFLTGESGHTGVLPTTTTFKFETVSK